MSKSANSRLEYVRENHQSPACALRIKNSQQVEPRSCENNCTATLGQNMVGQEAMEAEEWPKVQRECICERESQTMICINCKLFSYGRKSQTCPAHHNVLFLMDFNYCPNCTGPIDDLKAVAIDCKKIKEFNEGIIRTREDHSMQF